MPKPLQRHAADTVAVLDANSPPGLAFTRSLGRAGLKVRVYAPQRWPVARCSRYCSSFASCPDVEDAAVFLPWLQQASQRGDYSLVAPTSDLLAFYMAEFPECFPPQQVQAMPPRQHVLDMLFKDRFDAICKQHGVAVPWTAFPLSVEAALADSATLPYPIILKPKSHVGVGWARGVVVHNASELQRAFKPYPTLPQRRMIMERFPALAWPMLQEYVPEALQHLYSISGLLDQHGQVVAVAGSRKTLQWPPDLGVGVIFETWHDAAALREGLAFVQQSLGRGIFELEFIFDQRQQRFVAIDLNPRAHGHISFDIARHNNLPWLWYQLAQNAPLQALDAAADDLHWRHSIPYHISQLAALAKGPKRRQQLQTYVQALRQPTIDIINDARDPLPSLAHAAYMLRHPGGLIRPFL